MHCTKGPITPPLHFIHPLPHSVPIHPLPQSVSVHAPTTDLPLPIDFVHHRHPSHTLLSHKHHASTLSKNSNSQLIDLPLPIVFAHHVHPSHTLISHEHCASTLSTNSNSQSLDPVSFSAVMHLPLAPPIHHHTIHTPLNAKEFEVLLKSHPRPSMVQFLVSGISKGFRIGYHGHASPVRAPNLQSAYNDPATIDKALASEISEGRVAGPFCEPPLPTLRCSGLGLVPKSDGTWRLIFHLSAPPGNSVNDYIDSDEYSLRYHTIDHAISILYNLGPNALMAKADLKNAFRLCPVHPADWPLLGIHWRNQYFIDKCLPFGLRSSPFLFNIMADALQWCLTHHHSVTHSFHYLDDFFFAGTSGSNNCMSAFLSFQQLCARLGVPLKPEKLVPPSTNMTFLGIQLNSAIQIASLPLDKLESLLKTLDDFLERYKSNIPSTKRDFLSLIGTLSFATKVIPAGRLFLRRLLDHAHSVPDLDTFLKPAEEPALDILWWRTFASDWNGTAFFLEPTWSHSPDMRLFTDASSTIGFGIYWCGHWSNHRWSHNNSHRSIQWKEMFAILVACIVWGSQWHRKRVLFHCDNLSVVHLWRSGLSKNPDLMQLARQMFFVAACNNFHITVTHIAGVDNCIADALSRFHMQVFRSIAPEADTTSTPIPAHVIDTWHLA